jgi:hypothetical protein
MDERQLFIVQNKDLPKWLDDLDNRNKTGIPITSVNILKFRKHNKPLNTGLKGVLYGV